MSQWYLKVSNDGVNTVSNSYFGFYPSFRCYKDTTFRKLVLFPSSSKRGPKNPICWAPAWVSLKPGSPALQLRRLNKLRSWKSAVKYPKINICNFVSFGSALVWLPNLQCNSNVINTITYRPRWSSGSVIVTGSKIRRFKPGRQRWIFKVDESPWHDFLPRVSKAVGPMSSHFTAR
jgi:hypothetical protein